MLAKLRAWHLRRGLLIPAVLYGVFVIGPLLTVIVRALRQVSSEFWQGMYIPQVLWFTLSQAGMSALLSVVLAVVPAYFLGRYAFWGKEWMRLLLLIPFVLPTIVVGLMFKVFLPTWFPAYWAIIVAHVFYNVSIGLLLQANFWAEFPKDLIETARCLGAKQSVIARKIIFPLMKPVLARNFLLVFVLCFTSFGVVQVLGNIHTRTIEMEIYRHILYKLDLFAAVFWMCIQLFVVWFLLRISRPSQIVIQKEGQLNRHKKFSQASLAENILGRGSLIAVGGFCLLPMLVLLMRSFGLPHAFHKENYLALWQNLGNTFFFTPAHTAVIRSVLFASLSVLLSSILTMIVLYELSVYFFKHKKHLSSPFIGWMFLPMGISAVTLGVGFVLTGYIRWMNILDFGGAIVLSHTLMGFPVMLALVLYHFQAISSQFFEVAQTLGANQRVIFHRVLLPMIAPVLATGGVFAFLVSLGEFGASFVLKRAHLKTLPVLIEEYLSLPGSINFGRAMAASVVLMGMCVLGAGVMNYLQKRIYT